MTIYSANCGDARAVLSRQPTTYDICGNKEESCPSPKSKRLRAQLTQSPKSFRLTYDHKSDDRDEIKRIEDTGGFLMKNRVLGIMAVARSLGDHGMKEFVIGKPFVNAVEVSLSQDMEGSSDDGKSTESSSISEFVIIGCGKFFVDNFFKKMFEQSWQILLMILHFIQKSDRWKSFYVQLDGLWDVIDDQEAVDVVRKYAAKDGSLKYKETSAKMLCRLALQRGSTDNVTILVIWF